MNATHLDEMLCILDSCERYTLIVMCVTTCSFIRKTIPSAACCIDNVSFCQLTDKIIHLSSVMPSSHQTTLHYYYYHIHSLSSASCSPFDKVFDSSLLSTAVFTRRRHVFCRRLVLFIGHRQATIAWLRLWPRLSDNLVVEIAGNRRQITSDRCPISLHAYKY